MGRARSTKTSSQYRSTVLKPADILVDVIHDLPSEIEALLPDGLRRVLDAPPANNESNNRKEDLADEIAAAYRDKCRELAAKPGSEPEYRAHLYGHVVGKLAQIWPWRRILSANCSDKLWCASLQPPAPTPNLLLDSSTQISLDSHNGRVRHTPLTGFSAISSELGDAMMAPKPDITVGISAEAFTAAQGCLLEHWQAREAVCSDPHAAQSDMYFPFFFVEAKGLVTNGNLIGAQNQAAGGGTCAIRLLDSLSRQDPLVRGGRRIAASPIVFSLTTEGAVHELWVHYRLVEDKERKYYMTCLGAWRTTIERHANELVAAIAIILRWGVNVYQLQIKQVLDSVRFTRVLP